MRRAAGLALPLGAALLLGGASLVHCAGATALDVTIYSDVPCGKALDVAIVGGKSLADLASKAPSSTSNGCSGAANGTSSFGDIVLAPSGDKSGEVAFATMMRIDGQPADTCTDPQNAASCIIARRQIHFSPHEELHMRVDLRAVCAGISCAPDETCVRGSCIAADVTSDCHGICDESTLQGAPTVNPPPVDAGAGGDAGADSGGPTTPAFWSPLGVGAAHTCLLGTGGTVACWGDNSHGELGNGTFTESHVPVAVKGVTGAVALAAGLNFTCALTNASTVKCWGKNDYGELGNGQNNDGPLAVDVTNLSDVRSIATGCKHVCATTGAGGVWCWGWNSKGQIGNGTTANQNLATGVTGFGSGALFVTAGFEYTCVATATGARCWGDDATSQLGDGKNVEQHTPIDAMALSLAPTLLSAGAMHVVAYRAGRPATLTAWGQTSGVAGLSGTALDDVTAGDGYTCARRGAAVQCWGSNGNGQLGDDTTTPNTAAVTPIGLGAGVAAVRAGYDHACAVMTDGRVLCWGTNNAGQLGDGTTIESHHPVVVIGR
jgi:alpha-tubulin suppressor-like RCC1 family protein